MSNERDAMASLDELLDDFGVNTQEDQQPNQQQQYQTRTTQRSTMQQIDDLLEDENFSQPNNNSTRQTGYNGGNKASVRQTGYKSNRQTGVNAQASYRGTMGTGGDEDLDALLNQFSNTSMKSERIRDSEVPQMRATGINNRRTRATGVNGVRATGINGLRATGVNRPKMATGISRGTNTGPGRETMGVTVQAPLMSTGVPRARMTGPNRMTQQISTGVPRDSRLTVGNEQRITGPGRYTRDISTGVPTDKPRSVIATGKLANPVKQKPRKMATHTPDGKQVMHVGPACSVCGEKIIGKVVYSGGKPHHNECIKCSVCGKLLGGKKFTRSKEGELLCLEDYYNMYAPRCYNCQGRIKKKCVTVKQAEGVPSRKYHPEHFLCTSCGCELAGKPYKVDLDGDPFCLKCFGERIKDIPPPEHVCKICKRLIVGDYIKIGGQYIHPEHYECETCRKPFYGGDCWEYEGLLYCHEHYLQMLKKVCAACRKPITGRSLNALGRVWHPEHFVCHHCHLPFGDAGFWEKFGNPYCKNHYFQLFGQMCQKCGEPAVTDVVKAFGRAWHKEHFECGSCGRNLVGKRNIYNFQDKPLCFTCFVKLPRNVQKELKKRRAGHIEALKRRKKAMKEGKIQKEAASSELLEDDVDKQLF